MRIEREQLSLRAPVCILVRLPVLSNCVPPGSPQIRCIAHSVCALLSVDKDSTHHFCHAHVQNDFY